MRIVQREVYEYVSLHKAAMNSKLTNVQMGAYTKLRTYVVARDLYATSNIMF
jgi:hypothetical protein